MARHTARRNAGAKPPAETTAETSVAEISDDEATTVVQGCPHLSTAAEQVENAVNQHGEEYAGKAIDHAADWAVRNSSGLYTLAQAVQLLKQFFGHRD